MRNEKGITLMALVITIIVMLILAGVTLSLTVGSNGLVSKAQNAVSENRKARVQEEVAMAWADCETEYRNAVSKDFTINKADFINANKLKDAIEKSTRNELTVNVAKNDRDNTYMVVFSDLPVTYKIDLNGKIEEQKENDSTTFTFAIEFPDRSWNYTARTFMAEKGMTWGEWVESSYNTDKDFYLDENNCIVSQSMEYGIYAGNFVPRDYNIIRSYKRYYLSVDWTVGVREEPLEEVFERAEDDNETLEIKQTFEDAQITGNALAALPNDVLTQIPEEYSKIGEIETFKFCNKYRSIYKDEITEIGFDTLYKKGETVYLVMIIPDRRNLDYIVLSATGTEEGKLDFTINNSTINKLFTSDKVVIAAISE